MTPKTDDDDLLTIRELCVMFGGKKRPLDQSTIWRWVKQGKLPAAIRMSPLIVRWRRSECEQALKGMEGKR